MRQGTCLRRCWFPVGTDTPLKLGGVNIMTKDYLQVKLDKILDILRASLHVQFELMVEDHEYYGTSCRLGRAQCSPYWAIYLDRST